MFVTTLDFNLSFQKENLPSKVFLKFGSVNRFTSDFRENHPIALFMSHALHFNERNFKLQDHYRLTVMHTFLIYIHIGNRAVITAAFGD